MKLKELLAGVDGVMLKSSTNPEIKGIASDSRIVAPGNLFIARKGETHDGSFFIPKAIESGAVAVVTNLFDPFLKCPQIVCADPGKLEPLLASRYYGHPSEKLFLTGVTGSKGKTTTSFLCQHLLQGFGQKCGLMGTIETFTGKDRFASSYTTHGAIENQKFLSQMVQNGCKSAVMEISSHALEMRRVNEIAFDAGIFTNLYPDHLDYHKTMENYFRAKQKLFTQVKGVAIVNRDCPWARKLSLTNDRITFGIDSKADVRAEKISLNAFFVEGIQFQLPLLGSFNIYNILGAIALGKYLGKTACEMSQILASFPGVPGRLEKVSDRVFVDFAHTGESLSQALKTLRLYTDERIIVVYGSGGDRDPRRRIEMAKAADSLADVSIITSDNPRSEDPGAIANVMRCAYKKHKPEVILDRKQAISRAIEMATLKDIVLIAGKGHEKVQIFLNQTVTFDDVAVAKEFIQE